jgi:hypothetical protein
MIFDQVSILIAKIWSSWIVVLPNPSLVHGSFVTGMFALHHPLMAAMASPVHVSKAASAGPLGQSVQV